MAFMQRSCAEVENHAQPAAGPGRALASFRPLLPHAADRQRQNTTPENPPKPTRYGPMQFKSFKANISEYQ